MDMLSYFLGRLAGGSTGGSGGDNGLVYTDLVYNDDGSITLTDDEGQEHIMECEYVDGRLEKVKIDGNILDAVYEEDADKLIKLGELNIEVGDYPSEIGNIENLIDESGVIEDTEGTTTEKVEQLIEKAEDSNKWYENITDGRVYWYAFRGYTERSLPRIRIDLLNSLNNFANLFTNSLLESVDFYIEGNNATTFKETFRYTKNLKRIKGCNTSNCSIFDRMFSNSGVEIIEEPLDLSKATSVNGVFDANSLVEIRFVKETIKVSIVFTSAKLSIESVQSIIDGLATVTTAQTLTFNSAIILTDEQKATINAKGWTLAQ